LSIPRERRAHDTRRAAAMRTYGRGDDDNLPRARAMETALATMLRARSPTLAALGATGAVSALIRCVGIRVLQLVIPDSDRDGGRSAEASR
jgi:hypothetical protein